MSKSVDCHMDCFNDCFYGNQGCINDDRIFVFRWTIPLNDFFKLCLFPTSVFLKYECANVSNKSATEASQCIGLLLTLAFPLIKSTFNHLWPIFPRVELQAVLCFLPLLELSSWALSDGLSHLSPVHFSPSETLGVRQAGVRGTRLSQHTVPHEPRPGAKFPVYFQKKSLSLPQLWIILIYSCTVR